MSANIFEQYSIEEISKRTKISPISLRFIKNKEYEKIPRVKFIGFIKIIEREFNVDLSDLIEEFDQANNTPTKKEKPQKTIEETPKPTQPQTSEIKEKKSYLVIILAVIILIIAGAILYNFSKTKQPPVENNITQNEIQQPKPQNDNKTNIIQEQPQKETAIEIQKPVSTNTQNIVQPTSQNNEQNIEATNNKNTTPNTNNVSTTQKITTPKTAPQKVQTTYSVTIIPQKRVWYRAINLDTNKTIEYLTSNPKTLPKGNYYIKFGHGLVTIEYANKQINPDTKKIVRIILKNGKYEYIKNPPAGYPK